MASERLEIRVAHGETIELSGRITNFDKADKVTVMVENHRQGNGPVVPVVTLLIDRSGEFDTPASEVTPKATRALRKTGLEK